MQHHNNTIIKTQANFFNKICTSHFIAWVRKGYSIFTWERELKTEQNWNILPLTLMAVSVVSYLVSWCSTGGPEAQLSAGWWLSLLHLINNWSGPQTPSGYPRAPSAWCSFPYHISSITPSDSNWNSLTSVLTELYNSSTSTQSPTRFLKSHVGSSSSGNNCHAVHRSLSSGALVYECTMGMFFFFTSSHFICQFPPTRFPLITAIRMCHLLPVHHLGMAFLAGSKAKIQHLLLNQNGCVCVLEFIGECRSWVWP